MTQFPLFLFSCACLLLCPLCPGALAYSDVADGWGINQILLGIAKGELRLSPPNQVSAGCAARRGGLASQLASQPSRPDRAANMSCRSHLVVVSFLVCVACVHRHPTARLHWDNSSSTAHDRQPSNDALSQPAHQDQAQLAWHLSLIGLCCISSVVVCPLLLLLLLLLSVPAERPTLAEVEARLRAML